MTIRATTASGAFDEVTIGITDPPPPQPAPTTEAQLASASGPAVRTADAPASPLAVSLSDRGPAR